MLAEAATQAVTLEEVMKELHAIHWRVIAVLVAQVITMIGVAWGQRKIARNEVQLGDLIRLASARDTPKP